MSWPSPQLRILLNVLVLTTALSTGLSCSRPESAAPSGGGAGGASLLTIKGSDTMLHLVTAWSEEFMNRNADADLSVNGGGSGTGIAALVNKTTDICMSSRDIKPEEREAALAKGIHLNEITVARDGIAVAVHPENPVAHLTREQLEKIFTGAYTRWSEVGGADEPIIVLSRESSSGTYVFFQEHVLNKKDFVKGALLLSATNAIVQALSTDKNAIGYIGLGYAAEAGDQVKVLSIAGDTGSEPVAPNPESVVSGKYPIARALYFYTSEPVSPAAQTFIDFCLGPEGQQIVRDSGYVTIN